MCWVEGRVNVNSLVPDCRCQEVLRNVGLIVWYGYGYGNVYGNVYGMAWMVL